MKHLLSKVFNKKLLPIYAIVLLASFLRLQGVFNNSFAFTYDVGRDMLSLWDIVHTHKILLIGPTTGIQGVFYGPWWYYMLLPFFIIFNGNPQGIAAVMSLTGVLSVILSFYLGKKIGNSFLGICAALLTAISPALISSSTQIWNPNLAPLFVVLTLIMLERIYKKGTQNIKYLFILGILLGLNIDVEILWGFMFSLGIILSLVFVLRKKLISKSLTGLLGGIVFILLPRIIFELRHGFLMTNSFIKFLLEKTTEDKLDLYHFIQNRYYIHLDEIGKTFIHNDLISLILLTFTVVIIFLTFKKSSETIKNFIVTCVTTILTFYVSTLIFTHAIWPHYLVGLPVIYIFLFSISLFLLYKNVKFKIVSPLILIVFFSLSYIFYLKGQVFSGFWTGDASVYRNQLNVIDYVYTQAENKEFKYVVYTPPVFDYTYRYLFKWYGPSKYGYSPNDSARLAYFIIEPDPGYPDRPKWWIDARKNDGKIIKVEKLNSGIVVQTRIH